MGTPRLLDRLFVYGTLRPASAPPALAPLLSTALNLGAAWIPALLYDLGAYPGAVAAPPGAQEFRVHGEVLQLPRPGLCLPALDAYEGFDPASPETSLFVRTPCRATLGSGQALHCWVYLYREPPPAHAHIPGGRWAGPSLRG